MKGIFIAGTNTGVGKTYLACRLIAALKKRACVSVFKPVEAGLNVAGLPDDASQLLASAQNEQTLDVVCPFPLSTPCSPDQALLLASRALSLSEVAPVLQLSPDDFNLIEGAGGLCSPICSDALNIDLAKALGLPVVLVVDNYLGCVNHALLSLNVLRETALPIAGILFNNVDSEPHVDENINSILRFSPIPTIEVFNFAAKGDTAIDALAQALLKS